MRGEGEKERKIERGGIGGGRERKQDTRIVAYIVIALAMIVVFGFFLIFERHSNRRATLINKANIQSSVL